MLDTCAHECSRMLVTATPQLSQVRVGVSQSAIPCHMQSCVQISQALPCVFFGGGGGGGGGDGHGQSYFTVAL